MRISPSIASSNLLNVEAELKKLKDYTDIHIDIEDGNFVPNITFGKKMVSLLEKATTLPFSVHLMVKNPVEYIEFFAQMRCDIVFIHVECTQYILRWLHLIRQYGMRAGIALNPVTAIEPYRYLFEKCDSILLMTSEPDGEGEKFLSNLLPKIEQVRKIYQGELWCDGGIDLKRLELLEKMGVDVCVMGRAIFTK